MNFIRNTIFSRFYSTAVNPLQKERWDLLSAVCLERKPVITNVMNDIEVRFSRLLARIEFEKSYKSDHEMRKEDDKIKAEKLKEKSADIDLDQISLQTAQDFEDIATDEFKKFIAASRTTEADKTNNLNSLDRKLDRHLLLVIQQKMWDKQVWLLPQGLRMDGETLLQTAERVLEDTCGSDLKVQFSGNAPCGVYKYKYPKKHVHTTVGAKVFFFKAFYVTGNIETEKLDLKSFKWLGRQELQQSLSSDYYKNISQFLIDEE